MLKVTRSLLMFAVGVGAAFPTLASAQSKNATGAVFVMTNAANKNEVIAFERDANGTLGESVSYDTHGRGSGGITDPLESQGSLTFSQDHSLLFAVNAGSGDITVFNVHKSAALSFLSKTPSGGAQPSAIAESHGLVYVLNSGGAGSLVGFHLDNGGRPEQIKNSTAFLTGTTTGGASLAFSPDGQFLVATERVANNIDVFHVQPDGTLSPIVVNPNPAPGTFSVAFAPNGAATFRYLAWTNSRVRQVNEMIRAWRYGANIPTPFMPGESALFRAPVIIDGSIVFANNQEAKVVAIEQSTFTHEIEEADGVPKWTASLPSWRIVLRDDESVEKAVHMHADEREFQRVIERIKDEAAESRLRWKHLHEFQQSLAQLQSVYCLTVHRSQGSTFQTAFLDLT